MLVLQASGTPFGGLGLRFEAQNQQVLERIRRDFVARLANLDVGLDLARLA